MRDTIAVHDLSATELQIGCIDLATEKLVDGRSASEDDRLALNLNGTLAKTDEIGTDTCKELISSFK
jgi:hypothetical protein